MSNKYKHGDRVPTAALITRLSELSEAVTKGKAAIDREFVMRIPAELDYCPDLVLSQAASRLKELERRFPMQGGPDIDFATAEKIYEKYTCNQSLKRIGERGGFGWAEVQHMFGKYFKSQ